MAIKNKLNTPLFLTEKEIRKLIELMFFSHQDMIHDPDKMLSEVQFSRIHHNILYFVGKNKKIAIKELVTLLRTSKQNLSRTINQLVEKKYIMVTEGFDRRSKNLSLTSKGQKLKERLLTNQIDRLKKIIKNQSEVDINGFKKLLYELCNEESKKKFDKMNSTYD